MLCAPSTTAGTLMIMPALPAQPRDGSLVLVLLFVLVSFVRADGFFNSHRPPAHIGTDACPRLRIDGFSSPRCGKYLDWDGVVGSRPSYIARRGAHDVHGQPTCSLFRHPRWQYWVLGSPWAVWKRWRVGMARPTALLLNSSPMDQPEDIGRYTRSDGSLVDPWVVPIDTPIVVAMHHGRSRHRHGVRIMCDAEKGDEMAVSAPSPSPAPAVTTVGTATVRIGDVVKANWQGQGTYYSGKVSDITVNGTYTVAYEDGDVESNVPRSRIEVIATAATTATATAAATGATFATAKAAQLAEHSQTLLASTVPPAALVSPTVNSVSPQSSADQPHAQDTAQAGASAVVYVRLAAILLLMLMAALTQQQWLPRRWRSTRMQDRAVSCVHRARDHCSNMCGFLRTHAMRFRARASKVVDLEQFEELVRQRQAQQQTERAQMLAQHTKN